MKKRYLILTGLSLSLAIPFALSSGKILPSKGAFDEIEQFKDDFNNKNLNENWESVDATIQGDYSSLRIIPDGQNWSSSLIYSKYKIDSKVNMVEVSFDVQQLKDYGWLGFAVGQPSSKTQFFNGQYGFVFAGETTQYFVYQAPAGLKEDTTAVNSNFSPLCGVMNKRKAVFTFARQIDNTFKCDYIVKDSSGKVIGSKLDITTPNIEGYFSFNAYSHQSELLSFVIKDDSEQQGVLKTVCEEDFSKSSILYSNSGTIESEWYANEFSEKDVTVGLIGKANLENNNSSLTYKTKFLNPHNDKLDLLYKLEATYYLGGMSISAKTGFELSKTEIGAEGIFFGLERDSAGYYLLAQNDENFAKQKVLFGTGNTKLSVKLDCSVYFDGTVILSDGIESVSGKVDSVDGYFGLKTLNTDNNNLGACVDDFSFEISKYLERTAADSGQSFAGTKESEDEYGKAYEFYISSHDWHMGPFVRIPIYTRNTSKQPYVLFSNSSITSAFGPKLKYKDFIAKFDVIIQSDCNSSKYQGAVVGLQVGKNKFEMNYANAASMGIAYYNGVCLPVGTQVDYDQDAASKQSNPSLLTKEVVLNFVYVVRGNKIEMHYKTGDQPESELAQAKITATCSNTDGYVAVFGANSLSFKLTKLSIINLDYDVKESVYAGSEYVETIRHDFTANANLDGLIASSASVERNRLKILENGSIKTHNKLDANIIRLKVDSIENQLVIKQGNVSLTLEDSSAKKAVISSSGLIKEIDLGKSFVFNNSIFELKHAGTHMELRYVSGDHPISRIDKNIVLLDDLNLSNENAEIEITSKNGIASLKELAIFNIDSHVTIAPRNYDPAIDYFNPWVERDSVNGGKKIILIIVGAVGGAVATASITFGFIFVFKKKRGLKNEN